MRQGGLKFFQHRYFSGTVKINDGYPVEAAGFAFVFTGKGPFDHNVFPACQKAVDIPAKHGSLLIPLVKPPLDLMNAAVHRTVTFTVDDVR